MKRPRSLLVEKWVFYLRRERDAGINLGEIWLPPFDEKVPAEGKKAIYEVLLLHREMVPFSHLLKFKNITTSIEGTFPKRIGVRYNKRVKKFDNLIALVSQREA